MRWVVLVAVVGALLLYPSQWLPKGARLQLAQWLTSSENPLTARVMVNRFWYLLFGAGLADDLSDFGGQGAAPVYPELLDSLAVEFVESGWDTPR